METADGHMPRYLDTLSYDFACEEKSIECSHNTEATAVRELQLCFFCEGWDITHILQAYFKESEFSTLRQALRL